MVSQVRFYVNLHKNELKHRLSSELMLREISYYSITHLGFHIQRQKARAQAFEIFMQFLKDKEATIEKRPYFEKVTLYKEGEMFPAEDPFVWYQQSCDKYYAIVKDMHGAFTNAGVSLAFFESNDGLNWELAANPLASSLEVEWENGTKEKLAKLERAQILFEDDEPVMMYCASGTTENFPVESFNIHIPLKMDETDK